MSKPASTSATDGTRRRGRCWALVALACLALLSGRASAVDDVVVADVVAAQPVGGQNFIFNANQNQGVVDQWLFQRNQEDANRTNWNATLARQLAEVKQCCHLGDVQTKKLALAMQCDVEQFFITVDQMRERFPKADQGNMQEVQREMLPLQLKSQSGDFCGPDSFFEKVLPRILDHEQLDKYRTVVDQRRRERYLTAIDVGLLEIEDRVPLDSRQHDTLRRLLADRPLPRVMLTGWYMTSLIMFRLAQLPEDQLKPLFDESNWNAFNQDRMRYRGQGAWLQQLGVLSE